MKCRKASNKHMPIGRPRSASAGGGVQSCAKRSCAVGRVLAVKFSAALRYSVTWSEKLLELSVMHWRPGERLAHASMASLAVSVM